ncbi:hypothetical protein A0H81_12792 [Grifola frondosa]|uniref:Uncharacterized protein n=1 Tax=Grifola frondosa TaxID=5627 RepID=A0A1C7LSA0_GRIFR|nr:hypothetical protein A0H81_12792 [Grifola frondosa]
MGSAPTTYQESSECCDGYVDCRGLIEEEDDEMDEDESDRGHERPQSRFAQRMSDDDPLILFVSLCIRLRRKCSIYPYIRTL